MKLRHLLTWVLSSVLLASCATSTAPDGTITKTPDVPTIMAVSALVKSYIHDEK